MKRLKFAPHLVRKVLDGTKTTTWRLADEKNLSEGDDLELIDAASLAPFAVARITKIILRTFGTLREEDWQGHDWFASEHAMYASFREYYPDIDISEKTPVKIITFSLVRVLPQVRVSGRR